MEYHKIAYFEGQAIQGAILRNAKLYLYGKNYHGPKEQYIDDSQYFSAVDVNTYETILLKEFGYPNNRTDAFFTPVPSSDGGFFSSGWSFVPVNGRSSLIFFKCDSNLNQQFFKLVPPSPTNNHLGFGAVETPDKGFIVVGIRREGLSGDYTNALVIKVDSAGNQVFWKEIPHNGDTVLLGLGSIQPNINGTYIAVGQRVYDPQVGPGWERQWIVGLDAQGNVLWSKEYAENERSGWQSIVPSLDGNFYVCGAERDWADTPQYLQYATVGKVSPDGELLWYRKYSVEPPGKHFDNFYNVQATSDGGILCTGTTYGGDTMRQNAWIIKLDSFGCATPGCQTGVGVQELPVGKATPFTLFPNPTAGEFTIEVKDGFAIDAIRIASSDGREVLNSSDLGSITRFDSSLSEQPSGWYVCSVLINGVWYVRQFVLAR